MASPIDSLERLTARASSLEEFLQQRTLIEEYYREAARFFGEDRFQRTVFDKILEQLQTLARDVPEVGQRLWETRAPVSGFTIHAPAKSFGRRTSKRAWEKYVRRWIDRLDEVDLSESKRFLESLNKTIADFEAGLDGLSKKKKEAKRIEFYRRLHKTPGARSVAASVVRYHLVTNPGRNILLSEDADLLLHELERWRQHPEEVGHHELRALTGPLASLIRSFIPKRSELFKDTALFPPLRYKTRKGKSARFGGTSAGEYLFFSVVRPFHAIWRGLYLNECVAGYAHDLNSNHPARWAIPACLGTMTIFVVRGKAFQGYIQLIPVQRGDETYASLELQAPVLAKTILTEAKNGVPLFELCLPELKEIMPENWRGLLVSESFDANEAGCADSLRKSPAYLLAKVVGGYRDFSVADSVSDRIALHSPRLGIAAHYPHGLIFDANLPNSGWLRQLEIFSGKTR